MGIYSEDITFREIKESFVDGVDCGLDHGFLICSFMEDFTNDEDVYRVTKIHESDLNEDGELTYTYGDGGWTYIPGRTYMVSTTDGIFDFGYVYTDV